LKKHISDKIGKKDIANGDMKYYNEMKRNFKRSYLREKRGENELEQDITFQGKGWMTSEISL
jgi:hypothetical protein